MLCLNRFMFGSIAAGLLAFASAANAAPTGLNGIASHTAPPVQTVRYHGGFGGFRGFYGGPHIYGGYHRYGGWGYGYYRPYRYRYYAYPLVVYGGYPYYDDYYYGGYGYYDDDVCYYSRRYRARICPDD